MSKDRLLKLLSSGELYKLAASSKTVSELAGKIGMTADAYDSCARRIRTNGGQFPKFSELQAKPVKAAESDLTNPATWAKFGKMREIDFPDSPEEAERWVAKLRRKLSERNLEAIPDLNSLQDLIDTGPVEVPFDSKKTIVQNATVVAKTFEALLDDKPKASKIEAPWTTSGQIEERKDKIQISALKQRLAKTLDELAHAKEMLQTSEEAERMRKGVEPIVPREKSPLLREATAVALASDWHIEERVDPESVNGVNAYNIDIARQRCERFFAGFIHLIQYHQDHFQIRDALLWLGGDLITGYLREENLEHNELSPVLAIATLHSWLADGIKALLAANVDIALLTIVCNSGNHGRLTDKIRPSTREQNSIEWLLYANLAREFANEPRVKFNLPMGSQTYVDVYDTTFRFTHGDEAKFGGGVGGIMIPLKKAHARWQTVRHADVTVVGHFHQYHDLPSLVVNGSLIGYNPYALSIGAEFEPPQQSFFLVDAKRGKCMPSGLWVTES